MKKILNKKNLLFSLLILFSTALFSQGYVESELTSNGALIVKYNDLKLRAAFVSGGSVTDTLSLGVNGFMDDFSNEGPYPDTARWLNNYVYVNRDLPIAPPTLGVATFDGVNANGYPYDFSAGQYTSGKADTLTSKPIDLNLPGDTSVYFSFFYQPQGRGNGPDANDSLILEFKDPTAVSNAWKHVWASKGKSLASNDSTWKLVMLKIINPNYLKKGFQFRFSNWATLSGNGDHWSIDYVYLNKNRTKSDTIFRDVAFVYNTPSLIKTYSAVPYKQYDSTLMKRTSYSTTIRNNNPVDIFAAFEYKIYDENNVQQNVTYSVPGVNLNPYVTSGYSTDPICAFPNLNYVIPSPLPGKTKYTIESYFGPGTTPNLLLPSDTVRHTQIFDNYYAYDDGTAEISFGLAGFLQAQIAEKFTLNVADTLRCIDIYFNPQWTNASQYTFKLKVWTASGSGTPGAALFTSIDSIYTPIYNQSGRNQFTRYYLEHPVYLNAGMTFFIGIQQNTTQPINIGVDRNTNSQLQTYYNTSGSWQHPPDAGSLMMHPVLGSAAEVVGIEESQAVFTKSKYLIYPNPANDKLFILSENLNQNKISYTIIDIYGRSILTKTDSEISESIDISNIASGVYFIRLVSEKNSSTNKFIISR